MNGSNNDKMIAVFRRMVRVKVNLFHCNETETVSTQKIENDIISNNRHWIRNHGRKDYECKNLSV